MADGQYSAVVNVLRRAASARSEHTDRQLLEQFADAHDEAAFTTLVRRHGSLVLGVCRRVLRHEQDAEDAFQATFLVLARKARAVRWHESVANWLYGVAYRLALKVRAANARRQARALESTALPAEDSTASAAWQELRSVLDEELARLPEKYRAPLVLCYLQGKTRDEAAQYLGWTLPTVKGRLERGRDLLRSRLTRRGLALSAALFGVVLADTSAVAAAPALVSNTVTAAVHFAAGQPIVGAASAQALTLTQGVLRAMLVTKLKLTAAVLLTVSVLGIGTGTLARQVLANAASEPGNAAPVAPSSGRSGDATVLGPLSAEEFFDLVRADEAEGRRGEPSLEKEARGKLKALDLDKGTLTIVSGGERAPQDQTFNLLNKGIRVRSELGSSLKLADLKEGMLLVLRVLASDDVVDILVEAPMARVIVRGVDKAKRTILLKNGNEDRTDSTFPVAKEADITVDGKKAGLGDIKANTIAVIKLSVDKKTVLALQTGAGRQEPDRRPDAGRPGVSGTLKGVDADKKTVTVTVGREGQTEDRTFDVPDGVRIAVPGAREAKLTDLKAGMRVMVGLSPDGRSVIGIFAQPPGERGGDRPEAARPDTIGLLKAVDLDKKTLTVAVGRGNDAEQTYSFPADVKVMGLGREAATVADLKPGMRVGLKLAENKKDIVFLYASSGAREADQNSVSGVLKAVEAGKIIITISRGREAKAKDETFPLGNEVKVLTSQREARKIEDLKPGMRVVLVLSRDRASVVGVMVITTAPERGRPALEEGAPPQRRP